MKVYVERCTNKFRLSLPGGEREFISNPLNELWTKRKATEALNVLESLYGIERRKVKFYHCN